MCALSLKESHFYCYACFIKHLWGRCVSGHHCVCCISALMSMFNVVGLCCRPAASYISPT